MAAAGFTMAGEDHAGDVLVQKLNGKLAGLILQKDFFVIRINFLVAVKGKARIWMQIRAAHFEKEIGQTVEAFGKVGDKNLEY